MSIAPRGVTPGFLSQSGSRVAQRRLHLENNVAESQSMSSEGGAGRAGGEGAGSVRITVIVPVRNDPDRLRLCLSHLMASTCNAMEVLVMDDASTDRTPAVAKGLGARVVGMERQGGPGKARNRGAELARGEYLMFVDADVCVHPETVAKVAAYFEGDPGLDALFGSYDTTPSDPHFVSQYKNLFHHYVHQHAGERACTFWAGCGAIRRGVFLEYGGFDTAYGRPSIEDIELGVRLYEGGKRIEIKKDVQATHLKRWTLRNLIKTDLFDRGIPWTRLILEHKDLPNDLNLKFSQRVAAVFSVALVGAMIVAVIGAIGWLPGWVGWSATGLAAVMLAGIVGINHEFYAFFVRLKGVWFAVRVVPLHVLYYLYSGVALGVGIGLHVMGGKGSLSRAEKPPPQPSPAGTRERGREDKCGAP